MSHRALSVVCVILLLAGIQWIIIESPAAALQIAWTWLSQDSDGDSGAQVLNPYLQTHNFRCDGLFLRGQLHLSSESGNPNFPVPPNRIPRSPPIA
jgi:hypothetical protein